MTRTTLDVDPAAVAEVDVILLLASPAREVVRAVVEDWSSTTTTSPRYEHVSPAPAAPTKVNVKYLSHFQHALFRCE